MKKIKFFNGISATFALAAVALATTFTSCEKEEFNVKFEPNPAMVVFTPNVIDAATGTNVTAQATITGADNIVSTASDKALAKGSTTIKATITRDGKTAEGSVVVEYPAVAAGQVVSISPVIMLSPDFISAAVEGSAKEVGAPKMKYGNAASGVSHDGSVWATNNTDYLVDYTATWNEKAMATKGALTKAVITTPNEIEVKNVGEKKLQASAWSMYNAEFAIQAANVEYKLTSVATGETTTLVYNNPIYKVTVTAKEKALPGHEHAYSHGHGHGNNPNAGGGITLAD